MAAASAGTGRRRGMLTLEQLRVEVSEGSIDTVVLAFTDMQGRLQGKRLAAEFFLDEVADNFAEGCNYLLAVDADLNWLDEAPVLASPRQILQQQVARLAERGWTALAGTELEFIVYTDTYEE